MDGTSDIVKVIIQTLDDLNITVDCFHDSRLTTVIGDDGITIHKVVSYSLDNIYYTYKIQNANFKDLIVTNDVIDNDKLFKFQQIFTAIECDTVANSKLYNVDDTRAVPYYTGLAKDTWADITISYLNEFFNLLNDGLNIKVVNKYNSKCIDIFNAYHKEPGGPSAPDNANVYLPFVSRYGVRTELGLLIIIYNYIRKYKTIRDLLDALYDKYIGKPSTEYVTELNTVYNSALEAALNASVDTDTSHLFDAYNELIERYNTEYNSILETHLFEGIGIKLSVASIDVTLYPMKFKIFNEPGNEQYAYETMLVDSEEQSRIISHAFEDIPSEVSHGDSLESKRNDEERTFLKSLCEKIIEYEESKSDKNVGLVLNWKALLNEVNKGNYDLSQDVILRDATTTVDNYEPIFKVTILHTVSGVSNVNLKGHAKIELIDGDIETDSSEAINNELDTIEYDDLYGLFQIFNSDYLDSLNAIDTSTYDPLDTETVLYNLLFIPGTVDDYSPDRNINAELILNSDIWDFKRECWVRKQPSKPDILLNEIKLWEYQDYGWQLTPIVDYFDTQSLVDNSYYSLFRNLTDQSEPFINIHRSVINNNNCKSFDINYKYLLTNGVGLDKYDFVFLTSDIDIDLDTSVQSDIQLSYDVVQFVDDIESIIITQTIELSATDEFLGTTQADIDSLYPDVTLESPSESPSESPPATPSATPSADPSRFSTRYSPTQLKEGDIFDPNFFKAQKMTNHELACLMQSQYLSVEHAKDFMSRPNNGAYKTDTQLSNQQMKVFVRYAKNYDGTDIYYSIKKINNVNKYVINTGSGRLLQIGAAKLVDRGSTTLEDWMITDVLIFISAIQMTTRFKHEYNLAMKARQRYKVIDGIGHSLSGALVEADCAINGIKYVYNRATGILSPFSKVSSHLVEYRSKYDIVSALGIWSNPNAYKVPVIANSTSIFNIIRNHQLINLVTWLDSMPDGSVPPAPTIATDGVNVHIVVPKLNELKQISEFQQIPIIKR